MITSGSARLLELLTQKVEDVIPKGWKLSSEIAEEIERSIPRTNFLLREGIRRKIIEKRMFRRNINGLVRPYPHYFIKCQRQKALS
jgi:hypothetical protein